MLANSHLLWSALWYGIAVDAFTKAQTFVRTAARKAPGTQPPASSSSQKCRASFRSYGRISKPDWCRTNRHCTTQRPPFLDGLCGGDEQRQIASSEMILPVINQALRICGIMGYKNGTPFTWAAICAMPIRQN